MEKLTAKQQKIYDYIQTFSAEHGYPPSVREIGAAVGLKSPSTVHFHLKKLADAGKREEVTRTCTLTRADLEDLRGKFPAWKDADAFEIK